MSVESAAKKPRGATLHERLEAAGQTQLLALLPALSDDPAHPVLAQLERLDLAEVLHALSAAQSNAAAAPSADEELLPAPSQRWASLDAGARDEYSRLGMQALRAGSAAAVILSGGQGTRLGFDGPKGAYSIGMPSGKSLFQLHVERILRVKKMADAARVCIYVMTSDLNDAAVRAFFARHKHFGSPPEDVFFFEQKLLPCLTDDGKLIVESESSLALAPCGNGGVYAALADSGALQHMDERGVAHLHVYGIDNALTRPLDPGFIGMCIATGAECANKVVWRASSAEKVGVTAVRGGRLTVVEYSDLPARLAEAADSRGRLVFGAANVCNHYLSLAFVRAVLGASLPYHLARKKIPQLDPESRATLTPSSVNGVKLELFIFDAFPLAERWAVLEVDRQDEFAPVKNEPGHAEDSPDTARRLLSDQALRWVRAAGARVAPFDPLDPAMLLEVSPLLSYAGEGLAHLEGRAIALPLYLAPED